MQSTFNQKKVITTVAVAVDVDGRKFKFNVTDGMGAVEVGSTLQLTGTIKNIGEYQGEIFTNLQRCKVAGAKKLVATHRLILFADAKSSCDGFAVCRADGAVIEYGSLGLGCPDNGDNSDHEIAAALRAFDLARRVKESAKLECLALDFRFDAQWMTGMVGKAKPLRDFAKSHKLIVMMNWISGLENPADEWTTTNGGRDVADSDLAALAQKI